MALLKQREIIKKQKERLKTSVIEGAEKIASLKNTLGNFSDRAALFSLRSSKVDRKHEVFRVERNSDTYEIAIRSEITLRDYEAITPAEDWEVLIKWAKKMQGKSVVFINSTMEGGGVAMLRPPLVRMLRQLGVDAHWYVMEGQQSASDPNPFIFTKLMHNIMQRRAQPDERITEEGKAIHQQWNARNAKVLLAQQIILDADVIVIDDPQPAPLINYIKAKIPQTKIVWRNHIDTSGKLMADPSTPQGEVMSYLLNECGGSKVDAVITHPVEAFVYPDFWDKAFFAPATIDTFDDLNRELTVREVRDGIRFINREIMAKNTKLDSKDKQSFINPSRRRIALVARFDESKGMDKALALGVRTRQLMRESGVPKTQLPQIIILGNSAIDDPSGEYMFEKMLKIRRDEYSDDKKDIILMSLRHNYKAMNALMYVAPGYDEYDLPAVVAMQTSEAEGCETRISDWIRHSVPVVVSNRGGMSLQIVEGKSGHVIDFNKPDYDIEDGARFIAKLMTYPETYAAMRRSTVEAALEFNNREFCTTSNVTRLLRVFSYVLTGAKADKVWRIAQMAEPKS